ncbi:MAG: zinc metallopeptidase [Bacteroidota bacterium]
MGTGYILLAGVLGAISALVGSRLRSKFKHYSSFQLQNGLSGKQIAEKMLADHGITDVEVKSVKGQLTDHYNPVNKTVNLSEVVYHQVNASAAAVAAHEVGHAVQHATAYKWLTMRSKLVPAVNLSSRFFNIALIGGLIVLAQFETPVVFYFAIGLFAISTLFSLVTLPVEYDASNRALAWMTERNMVTEQEYKGAKDALKWAARTYLVAAIGSIATLIYFIMRARSSN